MFRATLVVLSALVAISQARLAYVLPDAPESVLRERTLSRNFDCSNRNYGFYADVDNGCHLFHVCLPIEDDAGQIIETSQFSFLCGDGTIFDQGSLSCNMPQDSVACESAQSLFDSSNAEFGIIPPSFKRR